MPYLKAIIFGAIGVIAETSNFQRQAFNTAFREAGMDWNWDSETYKRLLSINGGQARLRAYRDEDVRRSEISDAVIATVHSRKTHHYSKIVSDGALCPRPGVAALMAACKKAEIQSALCTSTSKDNVDAIARAIAGQLDFDDFACITTIEKIAHSKPAPDAYLYCLSELGLSPHEVVAIEDTPVSMASAIAAGIAVIATPGAMTKHQDFAGASRIVDDLSALTISDFEAVLAAT